MGSLPKIKTENDTINIFFALAAAITIILNWQNVITAYASLPEVIPTHFNIKGEIDGYGSKITLLLLPSVSTILAILLFTLARFPHKLNYPVKPSETNLRKAYSTAKRLIYTLNFYFALVFYFLAHETVQAANNLSHKANTFVLIVMPFGAILIIIFFLIKFGTFKK